MYYAFELPDPITIPAITNDLNPDEIRIARRFVAMTTELTESTAVNEGEGYTVNFNATGFERIDSRFTSQEAMRGFVTLFRQFYGPDEPASFSKVHGLSHQIAEAAADPVAAIRLDVLKQWGRAHRRLRQERLDVIVRKRMGDERIFAYSPIYGDDESPHTLIHMYNYGEYIHWDSQAAAIESLDTDPFLRTDHRYRLGESMVGLAHLYIGFGQVLRTLFPQAVAGQTPTP